jgi:hypothetical protein
MAASPFRLPYAQPVPQQAYTRGERREKGEGRREKGEERREKREERREKRE